MSDEEKFQPRIGRMRAGGSGEVRYLAKALAAAARSVGGKGVRDRRFDGSRIGRGSGVARVLGGRSASMRRVVVKARFVRLAGKGFAAARAHLRYLQRDGVTREGAPGALYGRDPDRVEGREFLDRADGDRHQFRFIVSAEDGAEYAGLKPLTRRLMAQMEADLGTRLDWVAVDHANTGHPHSHIVVRGVDDSGANLVIARNYLSHGLRARAAELVTLDLGPETELEIAARLRRDIGAERWTELDRRLVRERDADGLVCSLARDPVTQSLRAGRLQKLGRLGLAEELGGGRWRIAGDLEPVLRAMGERGDIVKTLNRALAGRVPERGERDHAIYDPLLGAPMVGRVVARGLADEHRDRHYLVLEATDGRSHYVALGASPDIEALGAGAVVRVVPHEAGAREADRTVAGIAAAHGGRYSAALHRATDPDASPAFVDAHVRRLEALRRGRAGVEREADGSWRIAPDHVARAEAYAQRQAALLPVRVERLSALPVERLVHAEAATWLDRELVANTPEPLRETGFGGAVRRALDARRQWLVAEGLAEPGETRLRSSLLAQLQRRELLRLAGALSDELGKAFHEPGKGERVEGILSRRIDAPGGRYALVERSKEFSLVPWRPVLERHIGKQISGIQRGGSISWTIGRERGPEIAM